MPDLHDIGWTRALAEEFARLTAASPAAPPAGALVPARVAEQQKTLYRVWSAEGELEAKVSGKLRHRAERPEDLPAVGDWVAASVRAAEGAATIETLLPRASALVRKRAGEEVTAQVLAANVDVVFLVTSLDRDFSLRRLERALAMVWECGASPVILLNKADACPDPKSYVEDVGAAALGVPTHVLSALTGQGIDALAPHLGRGKTAVLLGSSGVGKSTIANRLLGSEAFEVAAVRESDQRGRHTTTHRELVRLPGGGLLIDTPGLREIQLWDSAEGMQETFADVEEIAASCRFSDCRHESEPGCAVVAAVESGALDSGRVASWRKLQRELAHLARKQDARVEAQERRKWKSVSQEMRRRRGPDGQFRR